MGPAPWHSLEYKGWECLFIGTAAKSVSLLRNWREYCSKPNYELVSTYRVETVQIDTQGTHKHDPLHPWSFIVMGKPTKKMIGQT